MLKRKLIYPVLAMASAVAVLVAGGVRPLAAEEAG